MKNKEHAMRSLGEKHNGKGHILRFYRRAAKLDTFSFPNLSAELSGELNMPASIEGKPADSTFQR